MSQKEATKQRGRPAAASREDVVEAGLRHYLRGRRIEVQAIAAETGIGRATIYRWFGSRDDLIGEVVTRATEPVLAEARAGQEGRGGPGLLDTFDRFNRALADAPALRAFVDQERDAALRLVASGAGKVQPRVVELSPL
jgi:AcrR family transcriptional regulator